MSKAKESLATLLPCSLLGHQIKNVNTGKAYILEVENIDKWRMIFVCVAFYNTTYAIPRIDQYDINQNSMTITLIVTCLLHTISL